ncbi:MAG: glycosyltransferase family 4 protein, partial [Ktedonobacteraceae bacterium]
MKNTIVIDARTLGGTGLGRYVSDLLENFASIDHEFRFRVLCPNPEKMIELHDGKFEFIRAAAPLYSVKEQWEVARLAKGSDLLHCPHYNVPFCYKGRLVVTIHDLTHITYREFLPNRFAYYYAQFMLRVAARHARQIITDSQFSKRAICSHLDIREEKVHAILLALSESFSHSLMTSSVQPPKHGINRPYILYVGLLKPHKNVDGLIRAFSLLPGGLRDRHQLVVAGKLDRSYPALRQLAEDLRLRDQVLFTGHLSDGDLYALYAGARVFVLPSLNEGFGLPALEAMAYG